ncbi:MAG: hypothetical protein HY297_03775 [Thaumarchaeota archaeon]|nr:hypothetical protein [Nitrososphaerota archaeon]
MRRAVICPMKINRRRSGISQSLDLFIIVGAVLAVGGVVASAATGLIGSATSTPTLQLTSYTLVGGSAGASGGTTTLTVTLKNAGTGTVAVGTGFSIALGTNTITTTASTSCTGTSPTSYAGSTLVTWTFAASPNACNVAGSVTSFKWTGPATAVSLTPGQQLTFAVSPSTAGAGAANPITTGLTYQVTILSNGQSILQNVISQ